MVAMADSGLSVRGGRSNFLLLDKYETLGALGTGTFAKVYKARDVRTDAIVAIKAMKKDMIMKNGLMPRVKQEIYIMHRLRHPYVVRLYEVLATKGWIYFAMEYVPGGTLADRLDRGTMRNTEARRYFQQIISAVRFCHSRGVFHRDLKPENILIDSDENVKVSDFGLSALTEQADRERFLRTVCGTPGFVAPEVFSGKSYDGWSADMWSCGIILYALVAGCLPFEYSDLNIQFTKMMKSEYDFPRHTPPELKNLIRRLLDPHPETRMKIREVVDDPWFKRGSFKDVEYMVDDENDGWWIEGESSITLNHASSSLSRLSSLQSNFSFSTASLSSLADDDQQTANAYNNNNNRNRNSNSNDNLLLVDSSDESGCEDEDHQEHNSPPVSVPSSPRLNAFDLISWSSSNMLEGLLGNRVDNIVKRLTLSESMEEIVRKLEELAAEEELVVRRQNNKIHFQGMQGNLVFGVEIHGLTDSLLLLEVKKRGGLAKVFVNFYDTKLLPVFEDSIDHTLPSSPVAASPLSGRRRLLSA